MDATIVDTSPNDAFGFEFFIAACVSRKNNAYADTGFCGSFGSFFFFFRCTFGFFIATLPPVTAAADNVLDDGDDDNDGDEPVGVDGFIDLILFGDPILSLIGSGDGRFKPLARNPLSSLSSLVPVSPPPVLPLYACGECPI